MPLTDWVANRWRALLPGGGVSIGPVAQSVISDIEDLQRGLVETPDEVLREQYRELRFRAECGEPLHNLLPATYALVQESARRSLGYMHRAVQLAAGIALAERCIVDLATGEGKTLVATLPAALFALRGEGVWLVTANDYLAVRDAAWMRPVYERLGLTVSAVPSEEPLSARQPLYRCDVVHGTAREFGFDFLRDRIALRNLGITPRGVQNRLDPALQRATADRLIQRLPAAAIVDEADSVLIDEARTPLILSRSREQARGESTACQVWAAKICERFQPERDYLRDPRTREILLTREGRQLLRELVDWRCTREFNDLELAEHVERAILVAREYQRGRDYLVQDEEIVIVDPLTGRPGVGRRWQAGIHEAIEAREGVPVQPETGQLARITIQELFRQIEQVSGMTGTARESAAEFRRIYHTRTVTIPTHRPVIRERWPTVVVLDRPSKWRFAAQRCQELREQGRAILVGTKSVHDSEELAQVIEQAGLPVQVLNAERLAEEAAIVADAGQPGAITIATSLAGRGTDIQLASELFSAGGLHVLATELFESSRVDRQLMGRSGRQGDPGSCECVVSMADELLKQAYGEMAAERLYRRSAMEIAVHPDHGVTRLDSGWFRWHQRAQRIVERRHRRERIALERSEARRRQIDQELGLDPWLDVVHE